MIPAFACLWVSSRFGVESHGWASAHVYCSTLVTHPTLLKFSNHITAGIRMLIGLFNSPGVAGVVLQSPLLLINSVTHPLVQNLQATVYPKPGKLGS